MAVKFQYNKVSMQALQKELKIRQGALPTLKSKEAYLRVTIKKLKKDLRDRESGLDAKIARLEANKRLWAEFPKDLVAIDTVDIGEENVAGIKVPVLRDIRFSVRQPLAFLSPSWFAWGVKTAEELSRMVTEITLAEKRVELLEYARKKTTQKVNLYEKVQIPEFSEAILKIKRYLEDVENLDKAAQKITKDRQAAQAEAVR